MKIELKRIDDAFHLEATNEAGNTLQTDGSPDIGGSNKAFRPMQLLLAGIGSCSAIDVIHFLRKQRQELEDIQITVTATRHEDQVPSLFKTIHVQFRLFGDLDEKRVERSVNMSMEKYCSVAKILEKSATISWEYSIG